MSLKEYFNGEDYTFNLAGCDTDSVAVCKPDGKKFTEEECEQILNETNEVIQDLFGEKIIYEDDGLYDTFVVLKTKNYAMKKNKRYVKKGKSPYVFKGSSIKDKKAEKALIEYKKKILHLFLENKQEHFFHLYQKTILRTLEIGTEKEPIELWANRKTITKAVLDGDGKTERNVREACKDIDIALEDKIQVYRTNEGCLKLIQDYNNDHDTMHYVSRIYATTKIFENILDLNIIPKYHNKCNKALLEELLNCLKD